MLSVGGDEGLGWDVTDADSSCFFCHGCVLLVRGGGCSRGDSRVAYRCRREVERCREGVEAE